MDGWMECTHYIRLALPYARSSPHSPFSFLLHHRRYSPMRRECASSGWVGEKTGKTRIMMIILHYITLHSLQSIVGTASWMTKQRPNPPPKRTKEKCEAKEITGGGMDGGWGMGKTAGKRPGKRPSRQDAATLTGRRLVSSSSSSSSSSNSSSLEPRYADVGNILRITY